MSFISVDDWGIDKMRSQQVVLLWAVNSEITNIATSRKLSTRKVHKQIAKF